MGGGGVGWYWMDIIMEELVGEVGAGTLWGF